MDELEALATELRRRLPPVPADLADRQRRRLLAPRARLAPRRPPALFAIPAAVTALLLTAGAVWLVVPRNDRATQATHDGQLELVAQRAELRHTLGDGSVIQLEQGARGRLQDGGGAGVRFELERGRGSFSVTPNRGRRFSVNAGPYEVQVVGTKFNVDYQPAGAMRVAVEHGIVLVHEPGREAKRLGAGDRLELEPARKEARSRPADEPSKSSAARAVLSAPAAGAPTEPSAIARPLAAPDAQSWRELYQRRDYPGALNAARTAGFHRLTEELGVDGLADLADAARLGGDLPAALVALTALERRFPGSPAARNAGFLRGRVLAQSSRLSEAIVAFERYLAANPDGVYSLEAMGRLMELHTARGEAKVAQAIALRYLQRAPSGPYQRLARSLANQR